MKRLVTTVCVLFLCSLFAPAVMGQRPRMKNVRKVIDGPTLEELMEQRAEKRMKERQLAEKADKISSAVMQYVDPNGMLETLFVIQALKADDLEKFKRFNLPANGKLYDKINGSLRNDGRYYVLDSKTSDLSDIYARKLPIPRTVFFELPDTSYIEAAIQLGAFNIAQFLIENGASVDRNDMILAKRHKANKIVKLLSRVLRLNPASLEKEEIESVYDPEIVDEDVLKCIIEYQNVINRVRASLRRYHVIENETMINLGKRLLQETPTSCYQYIDFYRQERAQEQTGNQAPKDDSFWDKHRL